jgi:predicted transcriptional regulator
MKKRRNRSDLYQVYFAESAYSNEMMESFPNEDSISYRLDPFQYDETLLLLEDELKKEFWRIVETLLTDRQKEVIRFCADGYTQTEIAKKLKVNQSSVTKSLHGNVDYKNGKTIYGGSKKKLMKIIEKDEKIKQILDKMSEIRMEKW